MKNLWKMFRLNMTALYVMALLTSVVLIVDINPILENVVFAIFGIVVLAYLILYIWVWYTPDLKPKITFGDKFAFCWMSGVIFIFIKEWLWP